MDARASQEESAARATGRSSLRAAVIPLLITFLSAGAQQTKAKIDALPHYPVSGRVINGKDGAPIAGARVSLAWVRHHCTPYIGDPNQPIPDCAVPAQYTPEFAPVLTDNTGQFLFPAVPEGMVSIRAEAKSFFDEWPIRRTPDDPLGSFQIHGITPDIELRLLPSPSLHGFVLDEKGHPLANWPVDLSATRVYGQGFTMAFYSNESVKSGSDGSFAFDSITPGDYFLSTEMQPAPEGQTRMYTVGRWPDTEPGLLVPRTVHLDPATSATATIRVAPKPLHHLTGHFTPVPSTQVDALQTNVFALSEYGGWACNQTIPRDNGTIDLLVPDGRYKIVVQTATNYAEALAEVEGADLGGVSINLSPKVEVPVQISAHGVSRNPSMPGFSLLQQATFGFQLMLAGDPTNGQSFGMGTGIVDTAPSPDANGRTHFSPQASGTYMMVTADGPFWYVASITSDGHDLAVEPYVVSDQEHAAPIEVELRDDGGSVTGIVQHHGAPAAAFVYALPLFPSTSELRGFIAHADGTYHLEGLAPGNYRFLALDHEVAIPFRENILSWLTRGQAITVGRSANAHLDLRLEP